MNIVLRLFGDANLYKTFKDMARTHEYDMDQLNQAADLLRRQGDDEIAAIFDQAAGDEGYDAEQTRHLADTTEPVWQRISRMVKGENQ